MQEHLNCFNTFEWISKNIKNRNKELLHIKTKRVTLPADRASNQEGSSREIATAQA